MATTGQNDDDLIILSDNINTSFDWNPVISQNIDFWNNDSVISFDTPVLNWDVVLETSQIEQNEPSIMQIQEVPNELESNFTWIVTDSTLDLTGASTNELVLEQNLEKPENVENTDNSMSNLFWDVNMEDSLTTNEDIVDNTTIIEPTVTSDNLLDLSISKDIKQEDDSLWDMNAILNNTIDKLKLRQSWIELQKSTKVLTINDLESKIKELREQVTSLKREIVFLDDENIKIEINVWNLESMKLWKTTKWTTTKTREHNTKKLVKEVKALPQKS